jgi:hypothetical protein
MSISSITGAGAPLAWTNLNVKSLKINGSPTISYDAEDQASATKTGTASIVGVNYQKIGKVVYVSVFGGGSLGTIVASGGAGVLITPSSTIVARLIADLNGLDYSVGLQSKTGADFNAATANLDSAAGRIAISKADGSTGVFAANDVIFPFTISFLSLD